MNVEHESNNQCVQLSNCTLSPESVRWSAKSCISKSKRFCGYLYHCLPFTISKCSCLLVVVLPFANIKQETVVHNFVVLRSAESVYCSVAGCCMR